ncbi:MAG: type IV secretory system conjugative DNA transfer family protein [Rhodomicrobiaceae bacterium]
MDEAGNGALDLMNDIPRGVEDAGGAVRLDEQLLPMAVFTRPETAGADPALRFDGWRIFLGLAGGRTERRPRSDGTSEAHVLGGRAIGIASDMHMLTVAGSRAGKGRSVIVPTLLSYEGSVLAIDPKGELASLTARARAERLGQKVHVLDPFGVTSGYAATRRASFNPMRLLRYGSRRTGRGSATIVEDGGLIADALVMREPGARDPHWDDSARNLIEGVTLHVATWRKYWRRRHLGTVRDLIMGRAEHRGRTGMEVLQAEMQENAALGGRDAAEDFFSKPDDERESVLSTARRHIRFLSYESIKGVLSGHDFDLADLKRGRVTIYLCLPAMRMGTCNRWLRLFVNLALAAFETTAGRPEPPVLMCLDEFAVLGHLKTIEDAAGQIAGFGVRLWPIVQDLGQLKALYRDRWQTFMGNAGVLQFFGNNDTFTLDWVSKRLGTTSLIVENRAEVGEREATKEDRRGLSWSAQTRSLMTGEEIARFFSRDDPLQRQLIIWTGGHPLILQRAKYDSHELFAGLADDPESRH